MVCLAALFILAVARPGFAWNPIVLPGGQVVQVLSAQQVNQDMIDKGMRLVPQFRAGWVHQFALGDRDITARQADQDSGVTIQGYDQDSDAFVPGLGLTLVCEGGAQVYLRYDGELGDDMTAHEVQAGIRIPF